jgi:hypothetical protein
MKQFLTRPATRTPLVREFVARGGASVSSLPFAVPDLTREQEAREYASLRRERATLNRRISQLEVLGHRPATQPPPNAVPARHI